ncbi:SGNH/GDSL hydrolase family protein [Glycomyces tarimensis]
MPRRLVSLSLLALAVVVAAVLGLSTWRPDGGRTQTPADAAEVEQDGPVRVMPLGDSITGSPGCWRGKLWDLLTDAGHEIAYVGSQARECPPSEAAPFHEGHGGVRVTEAVAGGDARRWLEMNTPDVLLMHFGTNDLWRSVPQDRVLEAYTAVVEDLRELNPEAVVLVAQIIPLHPMSGCGDCPERAIDLNAAIPRWAAALSTEASPITVVDQHTGFDPVGDTTDGVHPNEQGSVKIAENWFDALDPILD